MQKFDWIIQHSLIIIIACSRNGGTKHQIFLTDLNLLLKNYKIMMSGIVTFLVEVFFFF